MPQAFRLWWQAKAGCCGAVRFHLNDHDGGKADMRANIDAWWPHMIEKRELLKPSS
jgi:Fe-S oxidoreductase